MNTSARNTALTAAAILVLLGGSAAAFANTSLPISLSNPVGTGTVTDLGAQTYTVGGGYVVYAAINGVQLTNPQLTYGYFASENYGSVSGSGTFHLTGILGNQKYTASGSFKINDNIAIGGAGKNILPGYFIADSPNIMVNAGGSVHAFGLPIAFETPYANPWGAPIVIYSGDCLAGASPCYLSVVATYSVGAVDWQGSQVTAQLTGTVGGSAATGTITDSGNEYENLVTGNAVDHGTTTISLSYGTTSITSTGNYQGTSTIPTSTPYLLYGTTDCSPGYTNLVGTCTFTGFQSQGSFSAGGIRGTYSTTWIAPAFAFGTTITGTLSQDGNSGGNNGGHSGFFGLLSFFHNHF